MNDYLSSESLHLSDTTLGAYVDGELDRDTSLRVEAAIQNDEFLQERVAALREVSMMVRGATRLASREPLPNRLTSSLHRRRMGFRHGLTTPWSPATVVLSAVACAAVAALLWLTAKNPSYNWQDQVLIFHEQYLEGIETQRPLPMDIMHGELVSAQRELASVFRRVPELPDLAPLGYELQGARVLVTPQGPLLYAVYHDGQDGGEPIGFASVRESLTSEPVAHRGSTNMISWQDGDRDYALLGEYSESELRALAASY